MRVANESKSASRIKLLHLTFEDFMEALVRRDGPVAWVTVGDGHL